MVSRVSVKKICFRLETIANNFILQCPFCASSFIFSAFAHGILFLKMIVINLSFCSREDASHLFLLYFLPPFCVLSSLPANKANQVSNSNIHFRSYASLSREDERKSNLSSFITHFVICRSCLCNSIFPRSSFKLKIRATERLIAFYNTEAK